MLSINRYLHSIFIIVGMYGFFLGLISAKAQTREKPNIHSQLILLQNKNTSDSKTLAEFAQKGIQIQDNLVAIQAVTTQEGIELYQALLQLGLENGQIFQKKISGWFPIQQINQLSKIPALRVAKPSFAPILWKGKGTVAGQGDRAQGSDSARTIFQVSGKGIKIGVLSDSYNNLGGALAGIASGDLPTIGVEVLSDLPFGGSDEGRAMLEIIHEIAPEADLLFRTAVSSDVDFALGIIALAQAGCDIIVDDIGYIDQPFFQDGIIAQAVDSVVKMGVAYFSSAGNIGNQSYQNSYQGIPSSTLNALVGKNYLDYHEFAPGDTHQRITIPPKITLQISFQWNEPFFSVTGSKGAESDLDIYLINQQGNVVARGNENNLGADPLEIIRYENTSNQEMTLDLLIGRLSGPSPSLIKYMDFTGLDFEYLGNSPTLFGQANASGAMAVGAAAWFNTPAFGINPPVSEPFSALGGNPVLFDQHGNDLYLERQKPEITAPDGVNTTFYGILDASDGDNFPNFFGTSAAVAHVAAVAALMLEAAGGKQSIRPEKLYEILKITSLDMNTPGFDPLSGFGFINAFAAIQSIFTSSVKINEIDSDTPGESDALEFIELFDGGLGNISLDGLSLVFYDRNGRSYQSFDLDSQKTNENGYFVMGSPSLDQFYGLGTLDYVVTPPNNLIQNGLGAIVLLKGNATEYPMNSLLPALSQIQDALVYQTEKNNHSGIFQSILPPGQTVGNEDQYHNAENHSLQRLQNDSLNTLTENIFLAYLPTPGVKNVAPPAPQIETRGIFPLNFGRVAKGFVSGVQAYQIWGSWLTEDTLFILAPKNFEVSLTENEGFSDTLRLLEGVHIFKSNLDTTRIFVRFIPNSGSNGAKNGQILHLIDTLKLAKIPVRGIEIGNVLALSPIDSLRNLTENQVRSAGDVKVKGIIHGINFDPPNFRFTLIEGSEPKDGIGLYFTQEEIFTLGLLPLMSSLKAGDEITIEGEPTIDRGLLQIIHPVSIQLNSRENSLQIPAEVDSLNEDSESRMVRLENVIIPNPKEWLGGPDFAGEQFIVQVSSSTGNHLIQIDKDTPLAQKTYTEILGTKKVGIDVIGIGSQEDASSPYDSSYLILPFAQEHLLVSELKLCIVSVNAGLNPQVDIGFEVIVQIQDTEGNPAIVGQDTEVSLNLIKGSGDLEGVLKGKIPMGESWTRISGLTYGFEEDSLRLQAQILNGEALEAGLSDYFAVESPKNPGNLLKNAQIKVFPNPLIGQFHISLEPAISAKVYIGIYNLLGQLIYSRQDFIQEGLLSGDLSFLQEGHYILMLKLGQEKVFSQIIKH